MSSPYLALDIGMHRTGVALSESGRIAQPLTTVAWKPPHQQEMLQEVVALCEKYAVASVIIGIPLEVDGGMTSQALKTEGCVRQLEELLVGMTPQPQVIRVNEFHSTQDAAHRFPNVDKDAAAAAVILQDYLDEHEEAW